jgi:plasmid maintenance system killer protein
VDDGSHSRSQQHCKLLIYRLHGAALNGNWRIIFRFEEGHATDVDLIDCH